MSDVDDLQQPVKVQVMRDPERVRLTDTRLLIIFVALVIMIALLGTIVRGVYDGFSDFRAAAVENCKANRDNTIAFNHFIGAIQTTTMQSPVLTPRERQQRVAFYQQAKQPVPSCPPAHGPAGKVPASPPPPPPRR